MMLQACLGLNIDGFRREVRIDRPQLPVGIDHLKIERLVVGNASLTIEFHRIGDRVVAMTPNDQARSAVNVMIQL
jgi:hypothetical protein